MARIPTPATQGAQNIGAIDTVRDPRTPSQNVRAGDFGAAGRALQKAGESIQTAAVGLDNFLAERSRKKQEALYLRTQRDISTWTMDYKNAYKSSATDANGVEVNPDSALGDRATDDWFDDSMAKFDAKADAIRASEEYQSLRPEDQMVIDRYLEAERRGFRADAATHLREQADFELQGEFNANKKVKKDAAVEYAAQPGQALARLKGYIDLSMQQAKSNGQAVDDPAVRVSIIEGLDEVADTSITNLLNSNDPNKVERARQWLALNGTIEHDGQEFSLSADKRNDLDQLINDTEQSGQARLLGETLLQQYGQDTEGAIAALNADPNIPSELKELAEARYLERLRIRQSGIDRQREEYYRNLSVRAGRGEQIGEAELNRLPISQRNTVMEQMAYAARGNPDIDDQTVRDRWASLSVPERAALSIQELNAQFRDRLTARTADDVLDQWTTARESHRGDVEAATLRESALQRSQLNDDQKFAESYFEDQIASTIDAYEEANELSGEKAAQLRRIARREFAERNQYRPMSIAEVDSLINDVVSRSDRSDDLIAGITDTLIDADGDPVGVTDMERSPILSAIPETERFDLVRWYRRAKGLTIEEPVVIDDFTSWLSDPRSSGGINWMFMTVNDIPANDLRMIREARPGVSDLDAVRAYRQEQLRRNSR